MRLINNKDGLVMFMMYKLVLLCDTSAESYITALNKQPHNNNEFWAAFQIVQSL